MREEEDETWQRNREIKRTGRKTRSEEKTVREKENSVEKMDGQKTRDTVRERKSE